MDFPLIPPLRGLLKNIWALEWGAQASQEKMVPFGCMDLVYVASGGLTYQNGISQSLQRNALFLTGQVSKPYHFDYQANVRIVGFGFYPHTAHLFLGESAFQFSDRGYPLADILPKAQQLQERLEACERLDQKVLLIQHFLHERLRRNRILPQQALLKEILTQQFSHRGQIDIPTLARQYRVSQRYLQKLFRAYVGLSPHQYSRVIRFMHALDLYQQGVTRLTDLALESGYYDQSHFIRDFKRFTGEAPGQYFGGEAKLVDGFITSESGSLLYNSVAQT